MEKRQYQVGIGVLVAAVAVPAACMSGGKGADGDTGSSAQPQARCPSGKTGPNCEECTDYATGPDCDTYKFVAFDFGAYEGCGVHPDGSVTCYSSGYGYRPFVGRDFADVAVDWFTACALRADGSVVCLDDGFDTGGLGAETPTSTFKAIDAGWGTVCGVRTDDTVECWGDNSWGEGTPPSGTFAQVETGDGYSCGLRPDGSVECWGIDTEDTYDVNIPPEGLFTELAVDRIACGLRSDGSIDCWGDGYNCYITIEESQGYELNELPIGSCGGPLPGPYQAMVLSSSNLCALRVDGTLECWGVDTDGETSPPSGEFEAAELGVSFGCGLRPDQTLDCWGASYHTEAIGEVLDLFVCSDGQEVPASFACDGEPDCADRSDEDRSLCR
ncbi:MAG TPA: hypothetical protein DFR83_26620 [Deltaproteobacteria bacterium]|nr:hypothetical protein [Deltaproteobacteria bacterium]